MSETEEKSISTSKHIDRLVQLAKEAVQKAQEESRRMGVPNVYSINDKLLYEWPNGELRLVPPPVKEP